MVITQLRSEMVSWCRSRYEAQHVVPAIFRSLTKTYTTASFVMYHRWLFVYFDIGHLGKIAKECEGFTDF